MATKKYLLFSYGTLKRNQPNEHYMMDPKTGWTRFVGTARTVDRYPLVIGSKYNIPFLLNNKGVGNVSDEMKKNGNEEIVRVQSVLSYISNRQQVHRTFD